MTVTIKFLINDSDKGLQDATLTGSSISDIVNQLFIRLQGVEFTIVSIATANPAKGKRS
jgi:hypothetical protein